MFSIKTFYIQFLTPELTDISQFKAKLSSLFQLDFLINLSGLKPTVIEDFSFKVALTFRLKKKKAYLSFSIYQMLKSLQW